MADVTDFAFREMFARYSKPLPASPFEKGEGTDTPSLQKRGQGEFVMYTEFVNVDGLIHPEGYKRLSLDLKFSEIQRPIVAQIWGRDPQKFYEAAGIVAKLGFDGIDINFGCPQDKEIGQGTCAALIREPKLAAEIIAATKEGSRKNNPSQPPLLQRGGALKTPSFQKRGQGELLPVSVKTRLGYNQIETQEWIGFLLGCDVAAIAIHARTKQEKSKVPAHWEEVRKAVGIRDTQHVTRNMKQKTLIIGNGDVKSTNEGLARISETGCDGVMIGRGAFGYPWKFRSDNYQPTIKERLSVMLEHARLFEKEFSGVKSFAIMRKHFKAYASGFPGSAELREKLMGTNSAGEVEEILGQFNKSNQRMNESANVSEYHE